MEWRNWRWIKALPARPASLFAVGASLVAILDRIDPLVAQQVMRDDLPAAMIKAIVIAHGALTFIFIIALAVIAILGLYELLAWLYREK